MDVENRLSSTSVKPIPPPKNLPEDVLSKVKQVYVGPRGIGAVVEVDGEQYVLEPLAGSWHADEENDIVVGNRLTVAARFLEQHGKELRRRGFSGPYLNGVGGMFFERAKGRWSVRVVVDLDRGKVFLRGRYESRKKLTELLKPYVALRLVELGPVKVGVSGRTMYVDVEVNPVSNIADVADRMEREVSVALEEYWEAVKNLKDTVGRIRLSGPTALAALYVVNNTGMDPILMVGRGKKSLTALALSYLQKVHPDIYRKLKDFTERWGDKRVTDNLHLVFSELKGRGSLRVDRSGAVYIDGVKVFHEVDVVGETLSRAYSEVFLRVLAEYGNVMFRDFKKWGVVEPWVVRLLAERTLFKSGVDIDTLIKVWVRVPHSVRVKILREHEYDPKLLKILLNKQVLSLVGPEYATLALNLLGQPSLVTEAVVRVAPSAIGLPRGAKLWVTVKTAAIDAGRFLVQVYRVEGLSREDRKEFIVYDKERRVGVRITARTVDEAVKKAEQVYDEAYNAALKTPTVRAVPLYDDLKVFVIGFSRAPATADEILAERRIAEEEEGEAVKNE